MACANDEIVQFVESMMTVQGVTLELGPAQYDAIVSDALGWYHGHLGQTGEAEIASMVPGAEYDVEDDCYVVFDVLFEQERVDHYTGFDFADVELPPPGYAGYGTAIGGMGSYSDFVSLLQYRKMGMQVTSSDPDWYFNDVTRKLSFSPSTGPATRVIYRYMTNSIDFGRMTMYQKSIVKRYALSQALLVVGLARSKFSSLPGTEGDITLNGSELIGQSEIMASGLEEKIKSMRKPIPIVVG